MNAFDKPKRIVIAGGSGFIGKALAQRLLPFGYEIIVLTRNPRERFGGIREIEWDGEHIGEWLKFLEEAEAVVNLTGKNVNCPHTPENLRELTSSRVNSVRAIAYAFEHIKTPPQVWVQASAVGFYGDTGDKLCDETSPNGSDNLAEVCRQWENTFNSVNLPKTRKVLLRIGFVLGRSGGALPVLEKLTKRFLGGTAGDGEQFISWIHLADLTQMFLETIERENYLGIFNAVGPNPVTNAEFMGELRSVLHRPWSPPAPAWAVKLGSRLMKSEPSLALASCRVTPKRFLETGFQFQYAQLPDALKNLYQ
ncbi:MAG TPA: TIGR01777 family oxidoreductase [Verrucomicrobiae bacterium]|nr:TIGR01777 family oxidoreductase [Verrucomicrobiae bacterium]